MNPTMNIKLLLKRKSYFNVHIFIRNKYGKKKYAFMLYPKVKVYAVSMAAIHRSSSIISSSTVVFWNVGWEFWESCDLGVF